jgi:hypothetical protein
MNAQRTNQTRTRPIIRARCVRCRLRLVGELWPDGRLFPARHPEQVEGDEQPVLCLDCADAADR